MGVDPREDTRIDVILVSKAFVEVEGIAEDEDVVDVSVRVEVQEHE